MSLPTQTNQTSALDTITKQADVLSQISSRNENSLKVFDEEKISQIAEKMPEINRATNSFGRTNSQVSDKLMSLTMISFTPYRYLHQCLAKIESRRQAIKDNQFRIKRLMVELEQLKIKRDKINIINRETELEVNMINIDIEEKQTAINDSILYFEGALKEIAVYTDSYEQIRKNHNIPENWDESDFEESEIENHIKGVFTNAFRDILASGRLNHGTLEYSTQMGINPITLHTLVSKYVQEATKLIEENNFPNVKHFNMFLQNMYETFKDSYKDQMETIGLDSITTNLALFKDDQNPKYLEKEN